MIGKCVWTLPVPGDGYVTLGKLLWATAPCVQMEKQNTIYLLPQKATVRLG